MVFLKNKIVSALSATGLLSKITRKNFDILIKGYSSDERTLDIGSAYGPYRAFFPNRVSVDVSAGEGIDVVADVHALPFMNGEFGIVLCTEALEHFHHPFQAVAEMRRVLRDDGVLILTTRFIFPLHDVPHDYFRFTEYGLRRLLDGFEIVRMERDGGTMETLATLLQRIGFQTQTLHFPPLKLLWFVAAKVVGMCPRILTKQYGEIGQKNSVPEIMTSGYFVVARKTALSGP